MFSDRWWILKAGAALGLLAWLCTDTRRVISALHPDIERVALYQDSLRGVTMHLWARDVDSVDETGFRIQTRVGPVHVRTANVVKTGDVVSAVVRPLGPRRVEAVDLRIHEGYAWKRRLNYGISIATVLVFLWLVRRRFRWAPDAGVFRSRF